MVDPEVKITYAGREEREDEEGEKQGEEFKSLKTSTSSPLSLTFSSNPPTTSHPPSPNFSVISPRVETMCEQKILLNIAWSLEEGNEISNNTNVDSAKIEAHMMAMFEIPRGRRMERTGGRED